MLSDQDEAEDALQQAFLKAHQALLGGTAPRELRPWLYAIARNCCLSAIAARKPTAALADDAPSLAGLSDQVHQREDLRELLAGIGRLPEDQRSALLLAELDDLSHQAIATIVECPVSKVKALIYQARSALIADRDARNTPCQDIREQLSVARGGELRRGPLRRHLKLCAGCRDFQLAVGAQRQSLTAVLPVLPTAGLAAAILGHGAAHAAGAASVGGAGVGGAGAGGAGVGATATGTGGAGIATTGTAATGAMATTAVGAGAGGGTGIGGLVGGGLITKLAVGGAVVALASAGAVTVHNREAHATPHRAARLQLDSSPATGRTSVAAYTGSSGQSSSLDPGSGPAPVLSNGTSPPVPTGSLESDPRSPSTELSALGGANPLLTPPNTLTPSLVPPNLPVQPAVSTGQSKSVAGRDPSVRARYLAALRRRLARARRRARLRHRRRAARRRARLRKALHRRHRSAVPKPPKSPVTKLPAAAPAPVRSRHRKVRPTQTPETIGQSTGASTTESEGKGAKGGRHHPPASTGTGTGTTGTGTGTTGTGPGTGTAKGTGSPGTGKGAGTTTPTGPGAGAGKSGSGKSGGSGGSGPSTGTGKTGTGKTGTEKGGETSGTGGTSGTGTTGTGTGSTGTGKGAGTATSTGTGTTTHTKTQKNLVEEEEQLPNL